MTDQEPMAVITEEPFIHQAGCPPYARLGYTDGEIWCTNCDTKIPAHLEPVDTKEPR